MSESLKELRALSIVELIEKHDRLAVNTQVGVNHYLMETARRDQGRQTEKMLAYTKWITAMTVAIMLFTVANVVIAFLLIMK